MNRCFFFRTRLALLATFAATLAAASAVRAQSPTPTPTEAKHDNTADIFDAIKKGADKLQKESKEAGKIAPQIKQIEDRQAEYIKHQEEMEHHLAEFLARQNEEIRHLTEVVERMETEIKAEHPAAPAMPVAPLPATEPAKTP